MADRHSFRSQHFFHRPILSDTLPFEVPPTFGNGGFFDFVTRYNVRLKTQKEKRLVVWECSSSKVDEAICVLFDANTNSKPVNKTIKRNGKTIVERSWDLNAGAMRTIPFGFNIAHKDREFRRLTIVHPRNQIAVADFYAQNNAQILYYTNLSDVSIRFPSAVSKSTKFSDRLFSERKSDIHDTVEQQVKEYANLGSYFTYKYYSNIFKFYEHYKYLNAEKKFDFLLRLDISKCFDSIYTHSMPWSTLGLSACKDHLSCSKKTFGGRFDRLLQEMNQGETNGIVIGPEFSRIFAEVILQKVDRTFLKKMSEQYELKHRSDFQVFRYVDDYFIFCNSDVDADLVEKTLGVVLREMKLSINSGKRELISKPIITRLTMAKNSIRDALTANIEVQCIKCEDPSDPINPILVYHPKVQASNLIVALKTILKQNEVEYKNVLNYTFAALEKNTRTILDKFDVSSKAHRLDKVLTKELLGILEFAFFIYASDPRINISVRLARLVSMLVDDLHCLGVNRDLKHQVMKYTFDNLTRQLRKSSSKQKPNIEVMYLILALRKLGRDYLLSEDVLASYFGFSYDEHNKKFIGSQSIDYFASTVLLSYTTSKKRYARLREAIEASILERFDARACYARRDTELIMIYLDLVTCPYVSMPTKMKLASTYGHSIWQLWGLISCSNYWFTDWEGFDLSLSLDKKRTREVY